MRSGSEAGGKPSVSPSAKGTGTASLAATGVARGKHLELCLVTGSRLPSVGEVLGVMPILQTGKWRLRGRWGPLFLPSLALRPGVRRGAQNHTSLWGGPCPASGS